MLYNMFFTAVKLPRTIVTAPEGFAKTLTLADLCQEAEPSWNHWAVMMACARVEPHNRVSVFILETIHASCFCVTMTKHQTETT